LITGKIYFLDQFLLIENFYLVHTYQSLFEPRSYTTLMCRVADNRKDKCKIQWFDPEDKLLNKIEEKTDLILKDANFDDNMGLYTCQICCQKGCQALTSFVYPVRFFFSKRIFF